jgi:hypothetical protein
MAVKIATIPTFEGAADLALMVWEMAGAEAHPTGRVRWGGKI